MQFGSKVPSDTHAHNRDSFNPSRTRYHQQLRTLRTYLIIGGCDVWLQGEYKFGEVCDIAIVDPPYGLLGDVHSWDKEAWSSVDFKAFFNRLLKSDHMARRFAVCVCLSSQMVSLTSASALALLAGYGLY